MVGEGRRGKLRKKTKLSDRIGREEVVSFEGVAGKRGCRLLLRMGVVMVMEGWLWWGGCGGVGGMEVEGMGVTRTMEANGW